MNAAWRAFGDLLRDNRWLGALLGIVASVATFLLAGQTVGFLFLTGALLLLLVLALRMVGATPNGQVQTSDPQAAYESHASAVPEVVASHGDAAAAAAPPASSTDPDSDVADSNDPEAMPIVAFDLAINGDAGGVRGTMAAYVEAANSPAETDLRQAQLDFLLVRAGDGYALARLAEAASSGKPPRARILSLYASALEVTSSVDQAVSILVEASKDFSNEDRALALIQAGRLLNDHHEPGRARQLLIDLVEDLAAPADARAQAWALIADGQREHEPVAAAVAYEKALDLDPSLSATRFSLAYHYSEMNQDLLARLHYLALEATNSAGVTAINNLGVANRSVGLIAASFDRYEMAAAKGSSLACANMAHLYLDIGATKGAEHAIATGEDLQADEPRLAAARSRLSEMRQNEERRASELAKLAAQARAVLRAADWTSSPVDLTGEWTTDTGQTLMLAVETDGFQGESADGGLRLALVRVVGGYTAQVRQGRFSSSRAGMAFATADTIIVILATPGQDTSPQMLKLLRTPAPDAAAGQ